MVNRKTKGTKQSKLRLDCCCMRMCVFEVGELGRLFEGRVSFKKCLNIYIYKYKIKKISKSKFTSLEADSHGSRKQEGKQGGDT